MENTKEVLYDEAPIEFRTNIKGWVSSDGRFWGNGEDAEGMARYHECTHKTCDCGNTMEKLYTKCSSCRSVASGERYKALEFKEWDGKAPLCLWNDDKFFFDSDQLEEWLEDQENDGSGYRFVLAEKGKMSGVNINEINDEYRTEDEDLTDFHPEIAAKVKELNDLIENTEPRIWFASKIRTDITINNSTI